MIKQKGQILVELLVAISLVALLLPALITGLVASRGGRAQQEQRLQATALVKQSQEAIRSIAARSWDDIKTNGIFHPVILDDKWILSPGTQNLDSFTIELNINDVFRDSSGKLVSSGGILDPSTKKIITKISWESPIASVISSTYYLARDKNFEKVETAISDFNLGDNDGTVVTNENGGEVILGAGGGGDWCVPSPVVASFDLPKSGTANAVSAIEGRVIAGTGENASGVSLADVSVSNANPPAPTLAGTFDGYKTNDVFITGNYGYLTTDNNHKEVVIVDLATHTEVGYFDVPGNGSGTSVYVSGTKGYVTAGLWLYIFDLSSQTGSRPQVGNGFFFLGLATSVVVNGNYAYVSLASSIIEMQIIDISNPQSLSNTGWVNVNGTDGKRIFVNSSATRAYLATNQDGSKKEFFIIDIISKTGSRPIVGSYEANGMNPTNLAVVPGNKAILVGLGAEEYQVVNITNEAIPVRCGGMQVDTSIRGIASVLEGDGDAYSYIVTGDASSELKIILGGPGGQFATSGTFTSNYFDAQAAVAFNRIVPNFIQPPQTSLRFQVAVATLVNGSCSNANYYFVGPDATADTYFTSSGIIPFGSNQGYTNPGQCFKYKAFLSTEEPSFSPILNDVAINYSP